MRALILAFAVAVGAIGSLWYTAKTHKLAGDVRITDRYNAAVTQLGSAAPAAQLGGIYALERIAQDSARDAPTILYAIGGYIRVSTQKPAGSAGPPAEVRVALAVAFRLLDRIAADGTDSDAKLDLKQAHLEHTTFPKDANFARVHADGIHVSGADLGAAINVPHWLEEAAKVPGNT